MMPDNRLTNYELNHPPIVENVPILIHSFFTSFRKEVGLYLYVMLKDVFLSWFPEKGGRLVNYNSGSNQGE